MTLDPSQPQPGEIDIVEGWGEPRPPVLSPYDRGRLYRQAYPSAYWSTRQKRWVIPSGVLWDNRQKRWVIPQGATRAPGALARRRARLRRRGRTVIALTGLLMAMAFVLALWNLR